jgi:hypothetical protein
MQRDDKGIALLRGDMAKSVCVEEIMQPDKDANLSFEGWVIRSIATVKRSDRRRKDSFALGGREVERQTSVLNNNQLVKVHSQLLVRAHRRERDAESLRR